MSDECVYRVVCAISPTYNLYAVAAPLSGLCELNALGKIDLKFTHHSSDQPDDSLTLWMKVEQCSTGKTLWIAIDLRDRADRFIMSALQKCDLYFKRGYYRPDLDQLPEDLRAKVRPFGLNYACRRAGIIGRLMSYYLGPYIAKIIRSPAQAFKSRHDRIDAISNFMLSPNYSAYEQPPSHAVEPAVLFQTRLWEPGSAGTDNMAELNEERAGLVRLLKKELGSQFQGGLIPTPYARTHYPDLLTVESCNRLQYIQTGKRALIGIYTRGIHHSLAFKLAEYLASSKCIVSTDFRHELPSPLIPDVHYLSFDTAESCLEQCIRLLKDRDLADRMRQSNWTYYQNEVHPTRRMSECLNQAFS
jgi:hypothetical protein